jgi:triosephosphate isomerase (TIM)
MKTLWIVANWKSNKSLEEALDWLSRVGPKLERRDEMKVVVCPTFSSLSEMAKEVKVGNYPIMIGSQDLSPFDVGSYTGEESASLLKQYIGISIIGHSERRKNFSETDEMVAQKTQKAIENEIIPLVCVQDANTPVPSGCKVIAYEPVFAIGTGNPDTPENANEVSKQLKEKHGSGLEILYGGSVNHENCKGFVSQENISGLLIGKSSLDPEEFIKIISECMSV